jgi:hypothetical protein
MSEVAVLGSGRTPIGSLFPAKVFLFEALVPAEGCGKRAGVNVIEDQSQIPSGSGHEFNHEFNDVSHAFS